MFRRIGVVALNTYREAVRARVLHGLFALALGTSVYAVVLGTLSLHQEARVIADVGSASISLYAVLVAIVLGATSLHRELELKTIFPILSRPLRRHEYLLGKYAGMLLTLAVFIATDAAAVLLLLAAQTGRSAWAVLVALVVLALVLGGLLVRAKRARVFVLVPWSAALAVTAFVLASTAGGDRQVVVASAALSMCELGIVAAVATLFSSFSSPAMTATFTTGVFLIGRSSDRLATLPERLFGPTLARVGAALAAVFPNLHLYVPPRPLLLGQIPEEPVWRYVGTSALHAAAYGVVLLAAAALIFRKRDFL